MQRLLRLPPVIGAALWMCLSIFSFVAMAVSVRQLSGTMSVFQMLGIRSVVGLTILVVVIAQTDALRFRTRRPRLHLARGIVHFIGQYGWALGVTLLPLAEVFALEFTVPVWVALVGTFVLKERMTRSRAIAVIGGFAGVLLIVRPGANLFDPAILIVLGAAVCFAAQIIMVKFLTRTDSALTILFYMALIQLPLGIVPALFDWTPVRGVDLPWLVLIGISGMSAHLGVTKALQRVDATSIFPVDFLRLPAIALVGYLWYGERLDTWVFLGAAIIFGANYYNLRTESRAHRQ